MDLRTLSLSLSFSLEDLCPDGWVLPPESSDDEEEDANMAVTENQDPDEAENEGLPQPFTPRSLGSPPSIPGSPIPGWVGEQVPKTPNAPYASPTFSSSSSHGQRSRGRGRGNGTRPVGHGRGQSRWWSEPGTPDCEPPSPPESPEWQ